VKVYVLTEGEYSDRTIEGVFTTLVEARSVCPADVWEHSDDRPDEWWGTEHRQLGEGPHQDWMDRSWGISEYELQGEFAVEKLLQP
jgi:hypothetical protein